MFALPRGVGNDIDIPVASARWSSPSEVGTLVHRQSDALFLGAFPHEDMWADLSKLWRGCHEIRSALDRVQDTKHRAALITDLDTLWQRAVTSEVFALGHHDDSHFITIAGTRAGKGASAIIPNLCTYPGSVVVIDPKGENASITAAQRASGLASSLGQDVYVLDPFMVADVPAEYRGGFNPVDALDLKSGDIVDDAALLAESLIVPSGANNIHWDESAKDLIKGIILYAKVVRPDADLFYVRELLTNGETAAWTAACDKKKDYKTECPTPFFHLIDNMKGINKSKSPRVQEELAKQDGLADVISAAAFGWDNAGTDERGSILSNARRNTAFLDSLGDTYKKTLQSGNRTFKPSDLKTRENGVSVYLCLPATRMHTHSRWMRIMISQILSALQKDQRPAAKQSPILFVLDEFFTLGPMNIIENAAGFAAGYGIKLWAVLQDLQQLKAMYPKSWETFIANAGAVQVFGVSDATTCDYISKAAGRTAVQLTSHSINTSKQASRSNRSDYQRASPILSHIAGRRFVQAAIEAIGASSFDDTTRSGNDQEGKTSSRQVKDIPLIQPDEVARLFSVNSGSGLLLIKGRLPIWYLRMNYYESPWFSGRYIPPKKFEVSEDMISFKPFGERSTGAFKAVLENYIRP